MNQNSFQIVTWIPKCSTFRWFVSRWAPLKKLGSPGGQSVLPFHCYCPRNPPKQGPEKHVWWKCGRRPVGFKGWDCWQFHQILQLHIKIYPPQTLPIAPQNKTNIRIIELLLKIHVGGGVRKVIRLPQIVFVCSLEGEFHEWICLLPVQGGIGSVYRNI